MNKKGDLFVHFYQTKHWGEKTRAKIHTNIVSFERVCVGLSF
jgi:hypothetical protein